MWCGNCWIYRKKICFVVIGCLSINNQVVPNFVFEKVVVFFVSVVTNFDAVWIFCFVKFFVLSKISCVFINVEFELMLLVHSLNIALKFKGVVSVMSRVTLQ